MSFCPSCGAELVGDSNFCAACGNKISTEKVSDNGFLQALSKYDDALQAYLKDSSKENKGNFSKAFNELKKEADKLDASVKDSINMEWHTIENTIGCLRIVSIAIVKKLTFGMGAVIENYLLKTAKSAIAKAKLVLTNTPSESVVINLTAEQKESVEKTYQALIKYNNTIANYVKDSSKENKENFKQAFKELKEIVDKLDDNVKESICMDWNTIESSSSLLRIASISIIKKITFGFFGALENYSLTSITNATSDATYTVGVALGYEVDKRVVDEPKRVVGMNTIVSAPIVEQPMVAPIIEQSVEETPVETPAPQPVVVKKEKPKKEKKELTPEEKARAKKKKKILLFVMLGVVAILTAIIVPSANCVSKMNNWEKMFTFENCTIEEVAVDEYGNYSTVAIDINGNSIEVIITDDFSTRHYVANGTSGTIDGVYDSDITFDYLYDETIYDVCQTYEAILCAG